MSGYGQVVELGQVGTVTNGANPSSFPLHSLQKLDFCIQGTYSLGIGEVG